MALCSPRSTLEGTEDTVSSSRIPLPSARMIRTVPTKGTGRTTERPLIPIHLLETASPPKAKTNWSLSGPLEKEEEAHRALLLEDLVVEAVAAGQTCRPPGALEKGPAVLQ